MANDNTLGPTVLVKKADGTTERVALSTLRSKKQPSSPLEPKPAAVPGTPISIPSRKSEEAVKAEPPKLTFADAIAELEERQRVLKEKIHWQVDDHKSLLDDSFHGEDLTAVAEARRQALARVSPVKDIWKDMGAAKDKKTYNRLPIVDTSVQPTVARAVKPMLHDVVAPPSAAFQSVGPVDELRQMTLTDFRRLAPSVSAAQSRLLEKFETLKADSHLFYMDGVAAWYQSPIYRAYQEILLESLVMKKPVAAILKDRGGEVMRMEEIMAIVKVNQMLL